MTTYVEVLKLLYTTVSPAKVWSRSSAHPRISILMLYLLYGDSFVKGSRRMNREYTGVGRVIIPMLSSYAFVANICYKIETNENDV